MTSILQTATGQLSETRVVVVGEGDMYNAEGETTEEYQQYGPGGDSTGTFLKTNLGSVSSAQVTVSCQNQNVGPSGTVVVSDAAPAEEDDFTDDSDGNSNYVDGTVIFRLMDAEGGGEIGDGTSLDTGEGEAMEFEVQVSHT